MENSTYVLLASIAALVCAVACGYLAWRKGRSVFWYVVFGYIFSVITLIVILVLPPKRKA